MRKSLQSTLRSLCKCELTVENLFNTSVSCDPSSAVMTYSVSVAFASQDGSVLASDLVQEAEQWVLGEREIDSATMLITSSLDNIDIEVRPQCYNLRAKDTLGPTIVSIVERMSSSWRFQNVQLQWE